MSDRNTSVEEKLAARRRIKKFLSRSADGLGAPVVALRDPANGLIGMTITVQRPTDANPAPSPSIEYPQLDKRLLDSVIVECRVFFLESEDCYLPSVVNALKSLAGRERAVQLRTLSKHVAQFVGNGRLKSPGTSPLMSGRLEMDNGLGPGRLLGADQIAMDYIYGVALHEDDERLARLANVSSNETINLAVILQLDTLITVARTVRTQILYDVDKGYVELD